MHGLESIRAINAWAASPECKKLVEEGRKAEKERTERESREHARTEQARNIPSGKKD